jgi:hypothetical protein
MIKIPIKAINRLSKELEKRDMLIPAEIILDNILEDRADIPINAIHLHSGLKADLYPVREGVNFGRAHFSGVNRWIMILPSERYISIHQKISFFISSCNLGSASNRNTPGISRRS